ncbi:transposase [Duganella aceris]|uniref:ISL3 family transposase n=1 Tax=Duganella aceris TaxID=2703883 RepID=A0ABX0FNI4_9BURK|nr:transposase [Duganella aceris]NGZ86185.1 ISL3 family transposase [Duganella aceris]
MRLIADPACPLICSHCDAQGASIHEACCRLVRDLPMAGMAVFLHVQVSRLRCANCCRCCIQRISRLDRHARVTRRSAEFAARWSEHTAFDLEVKRHCRKAKVVYDLFHVIAKYGREVIDRVRVDAANRLRHDKTSSPYVKRAGWLLLRSPANVPAEQAPKLAELLAANQALMAVHVMRASLRNSGSRRLHGAGARGRTWH